MEREKRKGDRDKRKLGGERGLVKDNYEERRRECKKRREKKYEREKAGETGRKGREEIEGIKKRR